MTTKTSKDLAKFHLDLEKHKDLAPDGSHAGAKSHMKLANMIMNKLVFSSTRLNNLGFQIGFDSKVENAKGVRIEGNSKILADHAVFTTAELKVNEFFVLRPAFRATYNSKFRVPLIPSKFCFLTLLKSSSLKAGEKSFSSTISIVCENNFPCLTQFSDFGNRTQHLHRLPSQKVTNKPICVMPISVMFSAL